MRVLLSKILSFANEYSESLRYRQLDISPKEIRRLKKNNVKNGGSILFGKKIKITSQFWYLHGLKEIFFDEVYKFKAKSQKPLIIDCGSNIGLSILYFKRLYPEAEVIGFEPDPEIFNILKFNIDQFGLKEVQLNNEAVWINNDSLCFKKNGSVGGHITDKYNENNITIKSSRLKDLLKENIDFLKLDIEGEEYNIVKDCQEKLKNVDNIFIEYHSFHENEQMISELLYILKNSGFRVYIKEAWENMKIPFVEKRGIYFDMQLNIFGYRNIL